MIDGLMENPTHVTPAKVGVQAIHGGFKFWIPPGLVRGRLSQARTRTEFEKFFQVRKLFGNKKEK